jgi:translation initiation factor 4E
MLAAIGETFDPQLTAAAEAGRTPPQSLITGVIVSTRPQFYRLSIWTRLSPWPESSPEGLKERIESVGRHFKTTVLGFKEDQRLGGPLATEVEFQSHKDSEKKGKSAKKLIV